MNIKQVGYFVAVFESGSFSVAARSRDVTVQAVSKAIHELENELDVKLFERSSHGVEPTMVGRSFYRKARPAVEAFDELLNFDPSAQAAPVEFKPGSPVLKLGLCAPMFNKSDSFCNILSGFICKSAGIQAQLELVGAQTALGDLAAGEFDALLTIGALSNLGCECVRMGTLPTGAVVAEGHPLAGRGEVTMGELAKYPAGESPLYDSFSESILTLYRKRGLVGDVRRIQTVSEEDSSFMTEDFGYFFCALLPVPGQTMPGFVTLPIVRPDMIDVPICCVTVEGCKSEACRAFESFLKQAIMGFTQERSE